MSHEEQTSQEELSPIEQIDFVNRELGLGESVIFNIRDINSNDKTLLLNRGSIVKNNVWFSIDDDDNVRAMLPMDFFTTMVDRINDMQNELFELRLEKAIWKHLPKDFYDVYAVVNKQLHKEEDSVEGTSDLDNIVEKVKKQYPNLFLKMDDLVQAT